MYQAASSLTSVTCMGQPHQTIVQADADALTYWSNKLKYDYFLAEQVVYLFRMVPTS